MADDDKSAVTALEDGSAVVTLADTSAAAEAFREGLPEVTANPPGTVDPPKVTKPPKVTPDAAETVEDLKRQVEQANAAKDEAQRRAADAAQHAQARERESVTFKTQAEQAQYEAVATAHDSATARMTQLEGDMADAMERGDFKASSKAQAEMARLGPRVAQLEDAKAEMEAARKAAPTQTRTQPAAPADPFEAHLRTMSPQSAAWVRAHPEYLSPKEPLKYAKLLSAHHGAVGDGLVVDTPEYFAHIEGHLGLREAESQGRVANAPVARERTMAAPVSRAPVGGAPRNAREVTLTPAQREAAAISGISEIEYARQLVAGQN